MPNRGRRQAFLPLAGGRGHGAEAFAGGLSEGVFFVDAEEDLEARWNGSREVMDYPILAEEFLHGPEFSVESSPSTASI